MMQRKKRRQLGQSTLEYLILFVSVVAIMYVVTSSSGSSSVPEGYKDTLTNRIKGDWSMMSQRLSAGYPLSNPVCRKSADYCNKNSDCCSGDCIGGISCR